MRVEDNGPAGYVQSVRSPRHKERSISQADLRRLVVVMVEILCEMNLPPEKVLIAVKAVVRDGIAPHIAQYVREDGNVEERRHALIEDAAQWCIKAYFEGVDAPNGRF